MASATFKTVSARALNAGIDMDMVSEGVCRHTQEVRHVGQGEYESPRRRLFAAASSKPSINWGSLTIPINTATWTGPPATSSPKSTAPPHAVLPPRAFVLLKNGNVKTASGLIARTAATTEKRRNGGRYRPAGKHPQQHARNMERGSPPQRLSLLV